MERMAEIVCSNSLSCGKEVSPITACASSMRRRLGRWFGRKVLSEKHSTTGAKVRHNKPNKSFGMRLLVTRMISSSTSRLIWSRYSRLGRGLALGAGSSGSIMRLPTI